MHYFDHNATTPLVSAARSAWLEAVDQQWMNPSGPYRNAASVKVRLDSAREELADRLEVDPSRVVFSSGATESNNAVFRNWATVLPADAWIAVSSIEHPSVIESAKAYFKDRIVWLKVDPNGVVEQEALDRLLQKRAVAAVSVMAANNETGVLQPWACIADQCRKAKVTYHCDAAQWIGKMSCTGLGRCSYVTACAHKFGGPKGVGFLLLPDSGDECRLLYGGYQESGHRAGTEDVAGVLSMLAAFEVAGPNRSDARDRFVNELCRRIPEIEIVGASVERLWNTLSLIMPDFQSVRYIRLLEKAGFLVSSGSACSSGRSTVSHVLLAMGIDSFRAGRVLRISSDYRTTPESWLALADALCEAHDLLKSESTDRFSTRVICPD